MFTSLPLIKRKQVMLKLQEVSKGFGIKGKNHRQVLNALSLEVKAGERIAIVGPSGSGKSTLLNMIGAMDQPDTGSIHYGETNITNADQKTLNQYRNKEIGFVFQFHHLLNHCNLLENVLLPTLPLKLSAKEQSYRAEEVLKALGIWDLRKDYPTTLSGGECQRAAVARALINEPGLLLADEPTGALDQENSNKLIELLLSVNVARRTALIVVTHEISLAQKMDKVFHLLDGKAQLKTSNDSH
jgi:ABC-type lipoprotein export system ATPase subunit